MTMPADREEGRMLRAALHVHSTYSDGEMPLSEIKARFVRAGCNLVCMADHAEFFDEAKLREYVDECRSLSDDGFLLMPGLEFGCVDRMHIVGYGVVSPTVSTDPAAVIEHIQRSGGISVIAHPAPEHLPVIPRLTVMPNGIEAWNSKYDGPAAPRPAVFALIGELRQSARELRAFYGLDLHWRHQFSGLLSVITLQSSGDRGVLDALRAGTFTGRHGDLVLPSDGVLPAELLEDFAVRNSRSQRVRTLVKRLKKMAGPLGRALPAGVKSQLRRFF